MKMKTDKKNSNKQMPYRDKNEHYLPGEELAEMVVEPEDAFPFPLESGRLGEGGEGMGRHRAAVRFLAALRGVLWFEERGAEI